MAIDNSSYDTLQETYFKLESYLGSVKMGPEHSSVIMNLEQMGELLESFDVEALEEQTKNINALHDQLDQIKDIASSIMNLVDEKAQEAETAAKISASMESIFDKIENIVL